jgi:neutral trehalase
MSKLHKAKNLVAAKLPLASRPGKDLTPEDVAEARKYIAEYWTKIQRFHPKDDESLLGLPKPYLVPSYQEKTGFDYNELYYWDSYFMVQGMLTDPAQNCQAGVRDCLARGQEAERTPRL